MLISIILAHPKPASFNHAIAHVAAETLRAGGHSVNYHDLCAEGFDPLLPAGELARGPVADPVIAKHLDELKAADGIIVVHPNWWAQPPAILKGWVDRVLRMGQAYEFRPNAAGEIVPVGLLKARSAIVFNTSNTPQEKEVALYGDPLDNLWKTCTFNFVGIKDVYRKQFNPVIISTPAQREAWLAEVAATVRRYYP